MRGHARVLVVPLMIAAVLLAGAGCGGRDSSPQRLVSAGSPASSPPCGVDVRYVPAGLKMTSVEGGPDGNNVDIRFASAQPTVDPRWAYVGVVWGPVLSLNELLADYPRSERTSVAAHDAVVARPGNGAVLLQWNQSDSVSVSVEGRGGLSLAEVRHIAEALEVPATRPEDLPGPPEAAPSGCSMRH